MGKENRKTYVAQGCEDDIDEHVCSTACNDKYAEGGELLQSVSVSIRRITSTYQDREQNSEENGAGAHCGRRVCAVVFLVVADVCVVGFMVNGWFLWMR